MGSVGVNSDNHEMVLAKLRQMLAAGTLVRGGRLPPERSLAIELGVGRRALRRALQVLEDEGRITRHQGRGTFVKASDSAAAFPIHQVLDHVSPPDVVELLIAWEPSVARLAALRASNAEITTIRHLAEQARVAQDARRYDEADVAFHRAIMQASRNPLFLSVFDAVTENWSAAAWPQVSGDGDAFAHQATSSTFHLEIAEAIAAREGDRAAEAMYRHLRDLQQNVYKRAFSPPQAAE